MVNVEKVGPGTLTIGEIGTEQDISCRVSSILLEPEKDQDDAIPVLCGDNVPGAIRYTWQMTATILQDWSPEGINKWSLTNAGVELPYTFVPKTLGPTITGTLVVDPLAIGGTVGSKPTSEVEWTLVGQPVWADPTP